MREKEAEKDYVSAGAFLWKPTATTKAEIDALNRTMPVVWGRTVEEMISDNQKRAYCLTKESYRLTEIASREMLPMDSFLMTCWGSDVVSESAAD